MPSVTVTGTIGRTPVFFPTSTPIQIALAQQILSAAFSSATTQLVTGAGGAITSALVVDLAASGSLLTGTASVPSAQIALGGQNGVYQTGGTTVSTVVAADNTNSSVVNNNPNGALLAATGIGGNVLLGLTGANAFHTGIGGQDLVVLNGAANSLTSNGSDAVLVGGPSTVTAAATGADNILLTAGTNLYFINGSAPGVVDSITGAANSAIVTAGYGSESIASGAGPETFFVDTSSGNVTLNGNLQATDTFTFVKNLDNATGNVVVNNFAAGDSVNIHGYGNNTVSAASGPTGGAVLQLSDGAQVTFTNVAASTLQQTIKIV